MTCPKCKAKVGIMNSEIILEHGAVNGCRCIICGYWKFDHPAHRKSGAHINYAKA